MTLSGAISVESEGQTPSSRGFWNEWAVRKQGFEQKVGFVKADRELGKEMEER